MPRLIDYTHQRISVWPGERTLFRKKSPFKTFWSKVHQHLSREIRFLDGTEVVISVNCSERDIKNDGMLRADARLRDPGVIVQFTARKLAGEPRLLYRCDMFTQWQDNVSAIARALEALRLVDRYGVTPTGEQYAGFKQLPSYTALSMTTRIAAGIVAALSDIQYDTIIASTDVAKAAVRTAKFRAHPDRNDGDSRKWDQLQVAIPVLTSHHGVSL